MNFSETECIPSKKSDDRGFDYWVILFGLVFIKLPSITGGNQLISIRLATLAPFFFVIFKNLLFLFTNKTVRFNKRILAGLFVYMCLLGISVVRSYFSQSFSLSTTFGNYLIWCTFASFSFFVFTRSSNQKKSRNLKKAIYYGIVIYVAVNVITYFLGLSNQDELYITSRPAIMLQFFNIISSRVLFPLASGINSFGIIAGASLCISVLLSVYSKSIKDKIIGITGSGFSIFAILVTDCRGSLFFAIFTLCIALILPKKIILIFRWLPIFAPLIPFIYIFIQRNIPFWIIQGLLRTPFFGNVDLLSGREYIWTTIINHFEEFRFLHLFGYGYHGEAISGLAQDYSYLFTNFVNSEWVTGHNYFLQTLLEIGYLGILIALWLLIKITTSLANELEEDPNEITNIVLFFLMIYFILAGTTETVLTTYHLELFYIFMLIFGSVGANRSFSRKSVSNYK